jgi:hypothetical protein
MMSSLSTAWASKLASDRLLVSTYLENATVSVTVEANLTREGIDDCCWAIARSWLTCSGDLRAYLR